jgi:hypothetical protein
MDWNFISPFLQLLHEHLSLVGLLGSLSIKVSSLTLYFKNLSVMLLFNVIGEANDEVIIELILEGVSNGTSELILASIFYVKNSIFFNFN